jgi:hypothetical protein
MTNLIDKRTRLKILKKNNKFMYKFYIIHLKSGRHIYKLLLLLLLYFAYRYYKINYINNIDKTDNIDNMADIKYNKNYESYRVKNGSKLSEHNYLQKYRTMRQTRVTPMTNKVIQKI